jgi:alpha-amylase
MSKVQFIFAVHNHQPVGNFEFVAEEAYRKAYLPFIEVLKRHPRIRVVLHYTGILYQFFEKRHPEFLETLRQFVAEGRAEILSGGFYEPILTTLPDEDKVGQVRMLTDYVQKRLGYESRGMWLAERVWEPHLPRFIAEAGIDHVVVDDFHFKMAGLHEQELDGYYLTEEQDGLVRIFPGSEWLRYLIPFHRPEETIDYLGKLRVPERTRLIVMADDGEKFGVWPETYHTVYEEGWLERFFTLLEENADWIEMTTFADHCRTQPPRGRIYLPTASYMEMGEWTLPTNAMADYELALERIKAMPDCDRVRSFMKGGIWRNFLAKYPESNHMHKRMLMVSRKVHRVLESPGRSVKIDRAAAEMLDHLYQSQCNDAYWHGVFGGLYLPHLRTAVYEHLIEAECLADKVLRTQGPVQRTKAAAKTAETDAWMAIEKGDFDQDGQEEIMTNSDLLNVFIDPAEGGRITELDWKPRSFNLMNTLTRRREGYHGKIAHAAREAAGGEARTIHERVVVKEEGLQHHLQYDWYQRASLLDHFLESKVDLAGFMRAEYYEAGDFVLGRYTVRSRKQKSAAIVVLERTGNAAGLRVRLRKTVLHHATRPEVVVRYEIANDDDKELNTTFGSEFNFSLLAGNAPDRYYEIPGHTLDKRNLASQGETNDVKQVSLVDEWLKLTVTLLFSQPAVLWRAPVETVSQSEAGFERVYQSSMVMPLWRISLPPGRTWGTEIRIRIT